MNVTALKETRSSSAFKGKIPTPVQLAKRLFWSEPRRQRSDLMLTRLSSSAILRHCQPCSGGSGAWTVEAELAARSILGFVKRRPWQFSRRGNCVAIANRQPGAKKRLTILERGCWD